MELPKVNLYAPFESDRVGPAPVALRVVVTPSSHRLVEGTSQSSRQPVTYVLLNALPEEIRRRVEIAVQAIITGGST